MKKWIFLCGYFYATVCYSQNYEQCVAERLKKDNFNLSFYELSFCINEIYHILENDTAYCRVWENRINRLQTSNLNYLKKIEYGYFDKMHKENPYKTNYPKAVSFIDFSLVKINIEKITDFAEIFSDYIEYPEQVDDACLIMLVCDMDCNFFTKIQNDEIAFWEYSNWLEYGFEEFRYYPGLSTRANQIINDRIINYILNKKDCLDQELVQKSISMIKSVVEEHNDDKVSKAYINDPDGYTNVREKPDTKSPILYKIYQDEPFCVIIDLINGNWYKIALYEKKNQSNKIEQSYEEGYIHKSRVKIIPKD
jgi:hypothetical protein